MSKMERWRQVDAERVASGEPVRGTIPTFRWGNYLKHLCVDGQRNPATGRRWSATAIVGALAPIGRYTTREVTALYRSDDRPGDPRLRRLAMSIVALVNVDPVWARTAMGLVRWECDVELDELTAVNAAWADYVNHLNALAAARPPHWSSAGDR